MPNNRIGIITLSGNFNYGNKLQLYACISIWKKLGFDATFLSYHIFDSKYDPLKNSMRKLLGMERVIPAETLSTSERLDSFRRFCEHIPQRDIQKPSKSLRNEYNLFSVGSDQVWNIGLIEPPPSQSLPLNFYRYIRSGPVERKYLDWFFLGFCRPEQRITMAPSLAMDEMTPHEMQLLRRGLTGFSRISIREKRGAEIIRECTGRNAKVICDPTIILSADEWRKVADSRLTPNCPYVFTYLLGGVGKEAQEVLDQVTDHGKIPVIPLSDRMQAGEPDAGPGGFVSLIDHASHVVTDSFHASVFSMLMDTPLTIVHREGEGAETHMFSRIASLAATFGLEDKIYGSKIFDLTLSGEYPYVSSGIRREKARFMCHLSDSLHDAGYEEAALRAKDMK